MPDTFDPTLAAELVADVERRDAERLPVSPCERQLAGQLTALLSRPPMQLHTYVERLAFVLLGKFENERFCFDADELAQAAKDIIADRDALRQTLTALVAKLDECAPAINSACMIASLHGKAYKGPSFGDELAAARALVPAPKRTPNEWETM